MRGRIRRAETRLFKISQGFLGGGVAEVKSAAIPEQGLGEVTLTTANTSPTEEFGVESRSQPQRRVAISAVGRTFIEQARRYDVSGAQESIAARHERSDFCGGQVPLGQGLY
jgi:hypothetical protein